MEYAEDDYLMISGIQHFKLQETMGIDSCGTAMGRK
mgnify:CR=1 FL=1